MPAPAHCRRAPAPPAASPAATPAASPAGAERVHELWSALERSARAEDDLPLDPRRWSRRDVGAWAARRGARAERFPMNGKALCLMSGDMFAAREPGLGAHLHRDFRRRLAKALALQDLLDKLMAQ